MVEPSEETWTEQKWPDGDKEEELVLEKSNILMLGPTGSGIDSFVRLFKFRQRSIASLVESPSL